MELQDSCAVPWYTDHDPEYLNEDRLYIRTFLKAEQEHQPEQYQFLFPDPESDLSSRRGQIQGQETRPGAVQIDALVPLSEMFGYTSDLRSNTQGRGQYTMEPHSYEEVPKSIAEKIMANRAKN